MPSEETYLQKEILLQLQASRLPIIAIPIPNSIYFPARDPHERSIIARVIHRMKTDGQILPGAPDLVLIWADGAACVEIKVPALDELFRKRPRGRPNAAQRFFADRLAAIGGRYVIVESWEQLWAHLVEWGPARIAA
jgi:hypothetical protein